MTDYRLDCAYLTDGWADNVIVSVSDAGFIEAISPQTSTPTEHIAGIVVPGMPNAHSHAFQRAMTGNAEFRASTQDSFWSWRQAMYRLANRVEPDDLQIIATQLFIEMLSAGYTSVAEFHYLHNQAGGGAYAGENPLWHAVIAAAHTAGIGLTLLPTLYQTSDFGFKPLKPEQLRFETEPGSFLRAVDAHLTAQRREGSSTLTVGAAFHSLRAVPESSLREVSTALRSMNAHMPVHIHVAEQMLEVQACVNATGKRPIELLLDSGLMSAAWCLVHATHASPAELAGIAASGATVCAAITTEANLGDGLFDAANFFAHDGRLCIGSDSQCTVSPAEELRWLEYQQRLRTQRRVVLATQEESHAGTRLWSHAARTGAQALGQPCGTLAVGRRADWLVLDAEHPAFLGAAPQCALDHLVFAGGQAGIRDVMVAGRWVIKNRIHTQQEASRARFAGLMQRFSNT